MTERERLQDYVGNGKKAKGTFSDAEMQRRLDAIRKYMADSQIDAALFTSYHNINYYADFMFCQFGRRYGFFVDHQHATSISAGIDGGQPWRRSFGDNVTYTDWRRDNFYRAIRQLTPGVRRLGIEFDHVNLDYRKALEAAEKERPKVEGRGATLTVTATDASGRTSVDATYNVTGTLPNLPDVPVIVAINDDVDPIIGDVKGKTTNDTTPTLTGTAQAGSQIAIYLDGGVTPVSTVTADGSGNWILMDYGAVVVHIFQAETRSFYDLERLWKDCPLVLLELGPDAAPRSRTGSPDVR